MTDRSSKIGCVFLLTILLSVGFMSMVPLVRATNDPANTHGLVVVTKEWDVIDSRTYDGMTTIQMKDHNVTVKNGGTLTLDNAVILFDGHNDGQIGIIVENGGKLILKNGSTISQFASKTQYCFFLKGSSVSIKNSALSACGGWKPAIVGFWAGIYIETDKATFDYGFFGHNPNANLFDIWPGGHAVIRNSTLDSEGGSAIAAQDGGKVDLIDCQVTNVASSFDGIFILSSNVTLIDNDIGNFDNMGVYVSDGYMYAAGNKIHNTKWNDGMSLDNGAKADLVKNEINNNNRNGLSLFYKANATLRGTNSIHDNIGDGIHMEDYSILDTAGHDIKANKRDAIHIIQATGEVRKGNIKLPMGTSVHGILVEGQGLVNVTDNDIDGGGITSIGIMSSTGATANVLTSTLHNLEFAAEASKTSTLKIERSVMTNDYAGVDANVNSKLVSTNNKYDNIGDTFTSTSEARIYSYGDTVTNLVTFGRIGKMDSKGYLEIHNMSGNANDNSGGMAWVDGKSTMKIYDCKETGLAPVSIIVLNGYMRSISSNIAVSNIQVSNWFKNNQVDLGWYGDIRTVWQNDQPAPNTTVGFLDKNNTLLQTINTDIHGKTSTEVIQTTVNTTGVYDHNKYTATGALNGMVGSTNFDMIQNLQGANAIKVMILDSSNPIVNIISPMEDQLFGNTTLKFYGTASDSGSGLSQVYVNVDSTSATQATGLTNWSKTLDLTEGKHKLEVKAIDISGNEKTSTVNLTIDLTAPVLNITSPEGLYVISHEFTLQGTTEIGSYVKVNGTNVSVFNGNFSADFDLPDGQYNITVESKDHAGNVATTWKTIIVDTIPPTITCDISNGSWMTTTNITINGTTDAYKFQATVGEYDRSVDIIQNRWSVQANLTEGTNIVALKAWDEAGLVSYFFLTINVDTIRPVIDISSPQGPYPIYSNVLEQTITGIVNETNLKDFRVDDVSTLIGVNGDFSFNVFLKDGLNTIHIVAMEFCDCPETSVDITFDINKVAPRVIISSPTDSALTRSASIKVEAQIVANDPAPIVTLQQKFMLNDKPTHYYLDATLKSGANAITVYATDRYGNQGTATITINFDNVANLVVSSPAKDKSTVTTSTILLSGTSENGAKIYINDVMIPANDDGSFNYKWLLPEGKSTLVIKSIDPAGNTATKTILVTRTTTKQFDLMTLIGLGLVLMIVGLLIGVLIGRMFAKPKTRPPTEELEIADVEPAPTINERSVAKQKVIDNPVGMHRDYVKTEAPKSDSIEEPEDFPEPAPSKKVGVEEGSFTLEEEPEEKPVVIKDEPKPEPKIESKPISSSKSTVKAKDDQSLDDLLRRLEK